MVKTLMYMIPNYSYWSRDRSHKENRNLKNWPHSKAGERERERNRQTKRDREIVKLSAKYRTYIWMYLIKCYWKMLSQ